MTRPDTVPDVLALVRRSRLVEDARLDGFRQLMASAHMTGLPAAGVLSLMVERGLLTRYQAGELAAGRWYGFWIGGYRVLDRLGRGGMGTVFLAEHVLLGKRVAVKVLAGRLQADSGARGRFLREAAAAAALDHPNVVRVYHADVDHDPPYLVMEYVDGISLQAAVARHGPFAPGEAAAVGVEVARGLAAAAAVGLIHR
ncbi:MAG: protein kinase, partial [Gemmataceae bacterium]|nr:protein kinase [Gemmataceae bacterium]